MMCKLRARTHRVQCASQFRFLESVVMPLSIVYLYTEYGVSSLKFNKLGGSRVFKAFTPVARAACGAQHR